MMEESLTFSRKIWLVTNEASGSNVAESVQAIEDACRNNGLVIERRSVFPASPLPTIAELNAAEIDLLAVFAGDGTANAVLNTAKGWKGEVLLLPGGTMNLFYHRLFGDLTLEQVLTAVGGRHTLVRRPGIVSCPLGFAYAEAMAGPGTAWSNVREAMRGGSLIDMAAGAGAAVAQTVAGNMVACVDPPIGRPEGYPLLLIEAADDCLRLIAYHAETAGEILEQAAAMAAREFRRGPHEVLAQGAAFTLSAPAGGGFGVLLDGERVQASGGVRFSLARCEVDLLAGPVDG